MDRFGSKEVLLANGVILACLLLYSRVNTIHHFYLALQVLGTNLVKYHLYHRCVIYSLSKKYDSSPTYRLASLYTACYINPSDSFHKLSSDSHFKALRLKHPLNFLSTFLRKRICHFKCVSFAESFIFICS